MLGRAGIVVGQSRLGPAEVNMPENKPPVAHYDRGTIQPIEFIEGSFTADEYRGFLRGNIIKYLARYRYKGTPEADLIKAQTYLSWLAEFERAQAAGQDERREPDD